MKAFFYGCSASIIVAAFATTPVATAQTEGDKAIGLVSKVIMDVSRRPSSRDWTKAQRGDILNGGDLVRTGERSIAVVKFKDNSMLRIQEKSLVTLSGVSEQGTFQKGAKIDDGVVGFRVQKQRPGEEFRFTSPTSVASIRGTEGAFALTDSGDNFMILTGLGRITNLVSMISMDVPAGYMALSQKNGHVSLRPATEQEKGDATKASRLSEEERHLRLQLKNRKGETRDLIIDVKE
jgi:hypothetical protein